MGAQRNDYGLEKLGVCRNRWPGCGLKGHTGMRQVGREGKYLPVVKTRVNNGPMLEYMRFIQWPENRPARS
jgi:hypothetical protein